MKFAVVLCVILALLCTAPVQANRLLKDQTTANCVSQVGGSCARYSCCYPMRCVSSPEYGKICLPIFETAKR
eukprot:g7460.t1